MASLLTKIIYGHLKTLELNSRQGIMTNAFQGLIFTQINALNTDLSAHAACNIELIKDEIEAFNFYSNASSNLINRALRNHVKISKDK